MTYDQWKTDSGYAELSPEQERQRELDRMNVTLDAISPWIIFANARRMVKREHSRQPNWVLARDLFGLGRTYAYALCKRMEVDPDGYTAERITPASRAAASNAARASSTV